eukprot:gene9836-2159_t
MEWSEQFKIEKKKKLQYEEAFDVEKWYPLIPEHTFKSEVLNFTIEEAKEFTDFYRTTLNKKQIVNIKDSKTLIHVQDKIDKSIKNMFKKNKNCSGVFVRLGPRSPKDTPMFDGYRIGACERFKNIFKSKMRENKHSYESIEYKNELYLSFASSLTQALKVINGNEAMDLLLNSERVFTDLRSAIDFSENFDVNIIIREWNDSLRYDLEFRCFVYQNQLNAISQYDFNFFSKELLMKSEKIKQNISNYFNKNIQNKLGKLENYVIDFGMSSNFDDIFVIELNPFNNEESKGTGSSLFNWNDDDKILKNGPLTIRVTQDYQKIQIHPDWIDFIKKTEEEIKNENNCSVQ